MRLPAKRGVASNPPLLRMAMDGGSVFRALPSWRHSSLRPVSGDSPAHGPVRRAMRRLMRSESNLAVPCVPCTITATHPAATLG